MHVANIIGRGYHGMPPNARKTQTSWENDDNTMGFGTKPYQYNMYPMFLLLGDIVDF